MTAQVVLTRSAERDFEQQFAYLSEQTAEGASAWAAAFHEALERLKNVASSLPEAPKSIGRAERIQQIGFKTRRGRRYRALYLVRAETVYVLHVRGPRQNIMPADEVVVPDA